MEANMKTKEKQNSNYNVPCTNTCFYGYN